MTHGRFAKFLSEKRGAAAAEFAIVATLLVYMMLNVVDLGTYIYARMQVENAAQAAAEKVISLCESGTQPQFDVTNNCTGIASKITAAAQATSLGTNVSAAISTSTPEAFYCSNGTGGMTKVTLTTLSSSTTSAPSCLLTVALNTAAAGDYLPITASFTYAPIFPGATVSSLLNDTITSTVWVRVA